MKEKDTRNRLVRYAGVWAAAGTLLAVPAVWWYHELLPGGAEALFAGGQPAAAMAAQVLGWVGLGLIVILLVPIVAPNVFGRPLAVVICLAALFAFGAGEWVREAVRKPYVIHGYMYSTGLRPDETSGIAESGGILAHTKWTENEVAAPDATVGKEVFRVACRSCHTLDGYNGLKEPLKGLDEEYLYELVGRLEVLRGRMPPFPGTDVERRALARYLSTEAGDKTWTDGRDVFEKRCGFCHTKEGFQPLYDSLQGYTREDVIDVLPLLGDMTDEMAPWSGTDEEADLLAGHILSWYAAHKNAAGGEN